MPSIAGYAYFSRSENYNYIPVGDPDSWDAAVRVYTVYDDGTTVLLGAGTYTAGLYDATGLRFGYTPIPEVLDGIPEYETYYGINPSGLVFPQFRTITERLYVVETATGDNLLDPVQFELSSLAPGAVVSGKNYIFVSLWAAPADEFSYYPSPQVVVAVVELTASFWSGITTTSDSDRVVQTVAAVGAPPSTLPFWTSLTGTVERL